MISYATGRHTNITPLLLPQRWRIDRHIRRMCELVGLKVTGLKRVRIGKIKLGDLPTGQWRHVREDESF